MNFLNKIFCAFDRWTDFWEFIARRPMDYVESFWLLIVILPFVGFVLVAGLKNVCRVWKNSERFRVAIACTLFFAVWPAIVVGAIIHFALSKVYAFKKISLKRTIHKGMDTYIRFFERGTLLKR